MARSTFCIVGAGMAGGRAAESLRHLGFDGRLLLLGDEAEPPYERPPLSKAYLNGELERSRVFLRSETFYRDQGVEWRPGVSVTALELEPLSLKLSDGEEVRGDQVLLATGSRPAQLSVPGSDLDGVFTYRDLSDADGLIQKLAERPRLVVVGGGFLGTELAAAARRRDCEVTVLELGPRLLAPLGHLVAEHCTRLQIESGVGIRLQARVASLLGRSRVEAAELADGSRIDCDLVLVCVGATPRIELAQRAGIACAEGILVDEHCRSSHPNVFAAGDVASWWSPHWRRRLRLEHYDNAQQQGLYVATAMLGGTDAHDPLPYFWTEQPGAMVQVAGVALGGATT
ncbi:MAG: NAD(P)/FAD-dependent oxidoreductase, partial [Candidatus Dormibacteria bacterium]